jgi:hypothetical protein
MLPYFGPEFLEALLGVVLRDATPRQVECNIGTETDANRFDSPDHHIALCAGSNGVSITATKRSSTP